MATTGGNNKGAFIALIVASVGIVLREVLFLAGVSAEIHTWGSFLIAPLVLIALVFAVRGLLQPSPSTSGTSSRDLENLEAQVASLQQGLASVQNAPKPLPKNSTEDKQVQERIDAQSGQVSELKKDVKELKSLREDVRAIYGLQKDFRSYRDVLDKLPGFEDELRDLSREVTDLRRDIESLGTHNPSAPLPLNSGAMPRLVRPSKPGLESGGSDVQDERPAGPQTRAIRALAGGWDDEEEEAGEIASKPEEKPDFSDDDLGWDAPS